MDGLRVRPAAEDVVDREELELGVAVAVARGDGRDARPEMMPRDDILPLGRVEEPQIRLGDGTRAAAVDDGIDAGAARLRKDADLRRDDLDAPAFHLRNGEQRLDLPRDAPPADS